MLTLRAIKFAAICVTSFALLGCTSLPSTLMSDSEIVVTNYQLWQQDAELSNELRLGGVIANITNLNNRTRIEVVNLPINSSGKPDINQEPSGRFVGYIDGFADPVTLSPGRLITFLGTAQGTEQSKVGQFDYDFPVMTVNGYHLWRIEERIIVNEVGSFMYPCRGLQCRDIHYNTRQGRVIQEVR